jgi:aspartate aminotransferase
MAFFDKVPLALPDPVFGLAATYDADPRPSKINLIMGVYKNPDLTTSILPVVKKAEAGILAHEAHKEYFSIEGDKKYLTLVGELLFGDKLWEQIKRRVASVQSVGGTGALRLGADLLKSQGVSNSLYYSHPTWINHLQMMSKVGMKIASYPYYDMQKQALAFDEMYDFIGGLPPRTIILLHASCHNPTGADPTLEQWKALSDLFMQKQLIPFFDFAYQGFGQGLNEDAEAVRLFVRAGHEMVVAHSFSKNFGLYGERVGGLFVVADSEKSAETISSQLKILIRTQYSNPPIHGAKIVTHILSDRDLKSEWQEELALMRKRIAEMKNKLKRALMERSISRDVSFLNERNGLFCFCGLQSHEVERLRAEYGIYTARDGRINVAGLNDENLERVADAIVQVSQE